LALLGLILSLIPHLGITGFIASRLLQGMGMAACFSLTRAMISDCYEGKSFAVVASYFSLVVSVFPAISPFLGGMITHYWGWRMNFWVLAVLAALAFILVLFKLPETHTHPKEKLSFLVDYKELLSHKHFYCYTLISGMSYATVMVYLMLLPFIATHHWHYTPRVYGYLALVIALSLLLGKLLNVLLLKYLNVRGMICLGLGTMLLFSVVMVGVSFLSHVGMLTLVLPLIAALTGAGMVFPNASSHTKHWLNP
jgi:MFS family permease